MAKKTQNNQTITGMRKALAVAHNEGNTKAINKDLATGAGADVTVLTEWIYMVETQLFNAVEAYIRMKKDSRWDSNLTEEKLEVQRGKIFPIWKECISAGEEWKTKSKLRVSKYQVEDLVGFAWKFMKTSNGTAEVMNGKQVFRKYVESLIGCEMAKNAMLTDEQRDKLNEYYGAQRTIQKLAEKEKELQTSLDGWKILITDDTSADFKEHIDRHIMVIEAEIEDVVAKKAEAQVLEDSLRSTAIAIEKSAVKKIVVA